MSSKTKFDPTKPVKTNAPTWARILATDSTAVTEGIKTPIIAEYNVVGLGLSPRRKVDYFTVDGVNANYINSPFPSKLFNLINYNVE